MKVTAITRFDRSSQLIRENNKHEFKDFQELYKYCMQNEIKIEVEHYHPAGINVQNGEER